MAPVQQPSVKQVFTERLAELLEETSTTKTALGLAIDKNNSTVGKWVSGDLEPNLTDLAAIARHFHRSVDWLLGLTDPKIDEAAQRARQDLLREKRALAAELRAQASRLDPKGKR